MLCSHQRPARRGAPSSSPHLPFNSQHGRRILFSHSGFFQPYLLCRTVRQPPQKNPQKAGYCQIAHAGLLQTFSEAFGGTEGDPGHWNLSPEWFGNQGGSWGHNAGDIIFTQESQLGNGLVTVTTHPASSVSLSPQNMLAGDEDGQLSLTALAAANHEWRVLRFNSVTRQSVCRIVLPASGGPALPVPVCIATEYLKTMLASVAAVMGLHHKQHGQAGVPYNQQQQQQQSSLLARALQASLDPAPSSAAAAAHSAGLPQHATCRNKLKVLFIGLGGGTLPLALHHHFPGMDIDAVELDAAVVEAARSAMAFPADRHGLRTHVLDGAAFVADAAASLHQNAADGSGFYDFAFIDTFDGSDDMPASLFGKGCAFLEGLAALLHPEHGAVIANLHGKLPPVNNSMLGQIRGRLPGWQNRHRRAKELPAATAVFDHAQSFRDALLTKTATAGCTYLISVPRQGNSVMVLARGHDQLSSASGQTRPQPMETSSCATNLAQQLSTAATLVGQAAGIKFQLGQRSCYNMWLL
ncbi:hypothetical protein WJX74_005835 [Apatococcus lobatus]|uniref:Uncharacterized protein n=1 Tax=Apatococcus lobatus TaxID=904363 RepID=A0AAW1RJ98_9CHLO